MAIKEKRKKKIFVIDDDKYITEAMQKLLEGDTYDVEAFTTGAKGIERAFTHPPDIILLDYLLPKEDTHILVEKLQMEDRTKHIPLVLISANNTAALAAAEWNMTAFLAKPFQINALLQLVQKYTI
ncbi:MAG TPA: response regulator [Candidatus Saccharimonadales bacterium]|nr:response regulator [Candidatus Saccharimonadales bacterium]